MTIPYHFDDQILFGSIQNHYSNRPLVSIRFFSPTAGVTFDAWGLIDTGADFLVLPGSWAPGLGVHLNARSSKQVGLADGRSVTMWHAKIDVEIRGKSIRVDALFGGGPTPLIGRLTLLKAMRFGIDLDGWLYRKVI